jgi:hypothetical protein
LNACDELDGAFKIERDYYHPSQEASKEGSDPFRAIVCPKEYAIAFRYAQSLELPRKLKSGGSETSI